MMQDALFAHALALKVLGSHGRAQPEGARFIAETAGLTVSLYPDRAGRPMLLTIDAPGRVLEVEFATLTDESPVVLHHVPGEWQHRLFKAAKPMLPWHDRTRWAAPWKRRAGWPFASGGYTAPPGKRPPAPTTGSGVAPARWF